MKRDLGDHIGKKKGWGWYELLELAALLIKKIDWRKKKKEPSINNVPDEHVPDNKIM